MGLSKEKDKFVEIVKNLGTNERKKAKSFRSNISDVYVAKSDKNSLVLN